MDFRISNTFTDSLGKLRGSEAKAVKQTVFDLQVNPANPGLQQHRIERSKDKHFWSVRVSRDIRIVTHRTGTGVLLCYVAHHDDAYRWAQRRKLEVHPRTGAVQLVVINETVREVINSAPATSLQAAPTRLFQRVSQDDLLAYGVPEEWVSQILELTCEEDLITLIDVLPEEASEALLTLAEGKTPEISTPPATSADPFDHPDAKRRFRLVTHVEELQAALEYPWEKWTVFLHPAQEALVAKRFNGPVRVSGSAGTGKTIVALHRAAYLAKENPKARVLLTTYSDTLATALQQKLFVLEAYKPHVRERVEIYSIRAVAERLYRARFRREPHLLGEDTLRSVLQESASNHEHRFSPSFIYSEWRDIVDGWQVETLDEYLTVERLGRKRRLAEGQRRTLWAIFEEARIALESQEHLSEDTMYRQLRDELAGTPSPYDFVVVDEAQDLSVQQLRLFGVLGTRHPDSLFFAGDMGQRIFQMPFSWKSLGVDIRGRGRTLKVNYRTSHQIRRQADRLLDPKLRDVDGVEEDRSGTVSVFNGAEPTISLHETQKDECEVVAQWLERCINEGVEPDEICIATRDAETLSRAIQAVSLVGLEHVILSDQVCPVRGRISICEMEQIKGLEFRGVAVMACDGDVIPSPQRLDTAAEGSDIEEIYNTERRLLYVACTRARDHLLLTSTKPESEFLSDLTGIDIMHG